MFGLALRLCVARKAGQRVHWSSLRGLARRTLMCMAVARSWPWSNPISPLLALPRRPLSPARTRLSARTGCALYSVDWLRPSLLASLAPAACSPRLVPPMGPSRRGAAQLPARHAWSRTTCQPDLVALPEYAGLALPFARASNALSRLARRAALRKPASPYVPRRDPAAARYDRRLAL